MEMAMTDKTGAPSINSEGESSRGLGAIVESFIENYFKAHDGLTPMSGLYDRVIQEIERPLLKATLKSVGGNQKKAAEILGINRNTLKKRLTNLQIDLAEFQ
jgi:DNA-binding protein Fis